MIDRCLIEGLAAPEREWLDRHTAECAECAEWERRTAEAVQVAGLASAPTPPGLAFRTQFRVSLRAQEMRSQLRGWGLWVSLALSWGLGVATAPMVWRAAEWAARSAGLPPAGATLAFGLWWAAPAAIAAGIWAFDRKRAEES